MIIKRLAFLALLVFNVIACSEKQAEETSTAPEPAENVTPTEIQATYQTDPVSADPEDDAADDPAIWYNAADPSKSLIIGSDKTLGVDVFDLKGKRLSTEKVGRINNVDARSDAFNGIDIVGGSNRDSISIDLWKIDTTTLRLSMIGRVSSKLPDVYGFCFYLDQASGICYALVNSKTGKVEQWQLTMEDANIKGELVRTLQLPGQVEGMVADDELNVLYVGVEDGGIFYFNADPNVKDPGTLIEASTTTNRAIAYDIEGLTLYYGAGNSGYLLASSQGNNSFAVYERESDHAYLGSFEVKDGIIDGVSETDGIDVSHHSFGSVYPNGVFICQDGFNYEGETKVAQNFKMVPWESIAHSFELPLAVTPNR